MKTFIVVVCSVALLFIVCIVIYIINAFIGDRRLDKKLREKKLEPSVSVQKEPQKVYTQFDRMIDEYDNRFDKIANRLGVCTLDIELNSRKRYDINSHIYFFEASKTVVIRSKEYAFSNILDCSLTDENKSETITTSIGNVQTSTSSMLRRTIAGGLLAGGYGAMAGAATAKQNISTKETNKTYTQHNYILRINMNDLGNPIITIPLGDNENNAQQLIGAFKVIVERNRIDAN